MAHKGPGKSWREGVSLMKIMEMFPTEEAAEAWFERQRWGKEGVPTECPKCGCSGRISVRKSRKPLPYHCGDCRSHFSVRYGTVMQGSKIPLRKWAIAIYLWVTNLKGVSSMKLHRDLDIGQKAAWFMGQRLREAWSHSGFADMFPGPVEVDESFFGGKERNRHFKDKKRLGRGPAGKTNVIGAKDRETGEITAKVVPNVNRDTLHGFIMDTVERGATLYTDEAKAYKTIEGHGYEHESVNHSVCQYVNDMAHTNGVESFWSLLKRGYHGTFHYISPEHLNRYIGEFATRHNLRKLDTIDMMEATAARMVGKRLTWEKLTEDGAMSA